MRPVVLAAAIAGLAALSASKVAGAAEDGPILPGYWESTSTDSLSNASGKTERKCITGRAINSYLTGPVNNHYSCRYDVRELHEGHAHMAGECTDSSGIRGKVVIDGVYAPEAFKLSGRLTVSLIGLKIPVDTSIDAHRISGECPAGVKVEDGGRKTPDASSPDAKPLESKPDDTPAGSAPPG